MPRPREFDEETVLDAATQCFWSQGYEATSVKDLIEKTGISAASLYNAFGEKRMIFRATLDRYSERSIADRIRRCSALPPRAGVEAFFAEIVGRSLADPDHKGCMVVNSALEMAPHDPELRDSIAGTLRQIEAFFLDRIEKGQSDGTIASSMPAQVLAQHLLGVLMGVRVLARVRPERPLLEGVVQAALALLGPAA